MRHCMACSATPQIATAVAAFALLTSIPAPNRNHSCRSKALRKVKHSCSEVIRALALRFEERPGIDRKISA